MSISRYCPNCNAFKEVAEKVIENETVRVCLTCSKSWSYTIINRPLGHHHNLQGGSTNESKRT